MNDGSVTATRKPLAPIAILDDRSNWQTVPFVLGTGFTGEMLLPEMYTRRLGLTIVGQRVGRPATGEFIHIPTGSATVSGTDCDAA